MKFPTKYTHYGYGWLDKIKQGYHPGIDYNCGKPYEDEGQDVIVITDGIVEHVSYHKNSWGWHVLIYHPKYKIYSHCVHLKSESVCVKEQEKVEEGQLIGLLGSTGNSTSPHLHFEIRLQKMSPHVYVNKNMTIEKIKTKYANPEEWIKEKIQQEQDITKKEKSINNTNKVVMDIKDLDDEEFLRQLDKGLIYQKKKSNNIIRSFFNKILNKNKKDKK